MSKITKSSGELEGLVLEMRRGVIVLAVLSQLEEEQYGYSLIKLLGEKGLDLDQGTLYPLLRRLESKDLLQSEWRVAGSRPRRYYRLSEAGSEILAALSDQWAELNEVIGRMIS
jgi:DNA-binding PadR family transcriptional regulator